MTLAEFVSNKPSELRLGQHFYNCYLHRLRPEDRMQHDTQELYNTRCEQTAFGIIKEIMEDYQWTTLPEVGYG